MLRLDVHRLLRSRCPSLQLLGLVVERHPRIELLGDLRQHVIGQVFEVARLLGELLFRPETCNTAVTGPSCQRQVTCLLEFESSCA